MSNFLVVVRRELRGFFMTPLAYVFTAIFVFLVATLTFTIGAFFERGEASLAVPFFQWHPVILALFAPAIGMRVWSEEHRLGTLDLLFSLPIPLSVLVLGKYVSSVLFMLIPLLLTFPMVLTVMYLGSPDYGAILSGYIGSFLVLSAFMAISCFCSSLSRSQVIAFVVAVTLCMLTVLIGYAQISKEIINTFPGSRGLVEAIASFGINQHFAAFRKGIIDLPSVLYFATIVGFSLLMNYIVLLKKRV